LFEAGGGVVSSTKAKSTVCAALASSHRCTSDVDFGSCRRERVFEPYIRSDDDDEREESFSPPPDFSNYTLPGEGFPGRNCGKTYKKGCKTCAKEWEGESVCNQRDCPICGPDEHDYGRWATIRGKAIRGRILDAMVFYDVRAHHVILSPPQDIVIESKADHKRFLAEARVIMRLAHIFGGVEIVHPWRSRHLDGTMCERPHCLQKHVWTPGVHLHNFCVADWISPGDYVYGGCGGRCAEGWILKRMDTFQPELLDYYAYALSHCGILMDDQTARHPLTHAAVWWGDLSYNKMPAGDLEHAARFRDIDFCPFCGSLEVFIRPPADEDQDARWLSKLGDKPPPVAICPDCGCGDCRLIRQAGPCDHVFIPDPYSRRVERDERCSGTCTPLIGESDMIFRCMSGYHDYLEPM